MTGNTPNNTRSGALLNSPSNMIAPRPPAPISAVTVASPTAWMVAVRTPASNTGNARGNSTRRKICASDSPKPRAAFTTAEGTASNPASVPRTTGSRLYSVKAITPGAIPTPLMPARANHGQAAASSASGAMSKPNSAMDGMVWMTLSTGNSVWPAAPCLETHQPSGTPRHSVGSSASATICT